MKVVIFAGGLGTRLSEETNFKPKPMIEIGDHPILWHIMKIYSTYGFNDFVICLGYKGYMIKEYFLNYAHHVSDLTIDYSKGLSVINKAHIEPWRVSLVDTGQNTMTGGRLARVRDYLNGETFMLTYGDGVADIDISKLLAFHKQHKKLATVTAVQPFSSRIKLAQDHSNSFDNGIFYSKDLTNSNVLKFKTNYATYFRLTTDSDRDAVVQYLFYPAPKLRLFIDGKAASYFLVDGLLTFVVPGGKHLIELRYVDWLVAASNFVFLGYYLLLLFVLFSWIITVIFKSKNILHR